MGGDTVGGFKVARVNADEDVPSWVSQQLGNEGIELTVANCETRDELIKAAADADVVWIASGSRILTPEIMSDLPRCGAIIRSGSGVDNIPVEAATRLGIVVANTPQAIADPVADHTVALLLAAERRIPFHDRSMRKGQWHQFSYWPAAPVRGRTLGLVGFGHTARLVARKVSGFDLRILASDPAVPEDEMIEYGVRKVGLDELLRSSDFVSLHCPLTDSTRNLISEAELQSMKKTAVLVNTSRGAVVDEAALVRALREGWIEAAALDVYDVEPIPPDSPLLELENAVLTPHTAAHTKQILENVCRLGVETVIDLSKGRWPRSCVNRDQVSPKWNLYAKGGKNSGAKP
ncbi:MAG: hypothetical protein A2Z18_01460 [Armatimonadetes bacterium RBG_16_58_9]|nr:MAG: hypothetical protein A2Z18_01460 [Armatimonadetes bacterium RBG_16_58_9]